MSSGPRSTCWSDGHVVVPLRARAPRGLGRFSFWGGDFYFYTAPSNGTVVTHLQTSTGATTTSPELGFTIVGAGVSTCAPTAPPQ